MDTFKTRPGSSEELLITEASRLAEKYLLKIIVKVFLFLKDGWMRLKLECTKQRL